MPDAPFIDRELALPPAQDYRGLRDLGLAHVQRLSGKIWTDHNSHDPGITILELLAYAITDLGYRTDFDVKDLLTRPDGTLGPASETGLIPAHEVLPAAALTLYDHRRLLARIEGVKNAWLDPMTDPDEPANFRLSEVPIYADCIADALSYETTNADGEANHPVRLSGLYKVLVELEIDDELGSLNETTLEFTVRSGPLKGVRLAINSTDPAFHDGGIDFGPDLEAVLSVVSLTGGNGVFEATVGIRPDGGAPFDLEGLRIVVIEDRPRPTLPPVDVTVAALSDRLAADDPGSIVRQFWAKQQARKRALDAVCCVLHANRSLCEDFLSVRTVAPYRVAVCADIDATPDADLEEVQARIFHAIETYLSPPLRFRDLEEMLAAGLPADEIFNGPYVDYGFECDGEAVFTKPGFLLDEALAASELKRTVYVSDLINLIADIEGVVAIRNMLLQAYDADGQPIGPSEKWKLPIPPDHQATLYLDGSKLTLFKDGLPYRAQQTEFLRTLEHLRREARQALYVEPGQTLPTPRGRWRDLDRHYPVQHDLPRIYGVGEAGLSVHEPPARVAKARQLKGYLAFFEQLLADYLSQLANARRLLSPDPTLERTYFPQYLSEIAGTRDVYEDEFYVDKSALQDDAARTRLVESEEVFVDRRNRALDHLIARFAERFADYAMLRFRFGDGALKTARELIEDKIAFLAEYPIISRERSKGFNYRPESPAGLWDTPNVSGLEKRVSRLLGIADYDRRDLACAALFEAFAAAEPSGGQFALVIPDGAGGALFTSEELFADEAAALDAFRPIFDGLRNEATFQIDASGGVGAVTLTLAAGGGTLVDANRFETEADAVNAARALLDRYDALLQSQICDDEGMHLIEHILLRPFSDQDRLMQVCLDPECAFCGAEDPYSFRVSIYLPYWPARFQDLNFRRFAERVIREETPAHIHPRICWIGNEDMAAIDRAYRAWIEAKAPKQPDAATLRTATADLIEAMEAATSVYPAATLHDCDDDGGEGGPVVRLGETALGLF